MPGFKKAVSKARGSKRATKKRKVEAPNYSRASGAMATKRNKAELKYFDSSNTGTALVASAAWANTMVDPIALPIANINCLFAPAAGSAINQRIGRKVTMWKLKVRGAVICATQAAQNAGDSGTWIRIILVQDKQTNATQMTGAQLIGDVVNANTTQFSFQNPDQFGRFRVLKDKIMILQNPSQTGSPTAADVVQNGILRNFKLSMRFKKGIDVHFNSTSTGIIGDIIDNSLHLVANTSSVALAPTLSYACRVTYSDA